MGDAALDKERFLDLLDSIAEIFQRLFEHHGSGFLQLLPCRQRRLFKGSRGACSVVGLHLVAQFSGERFGTFRRRRLGDLLRQSIEGGGQRRTRIEVEAVEHAFDELLAGRGDVSTGPGKSRPGEKSGELLLRRNAGGQQLLHLGR